MNKTITFLGALTIASSPALALNVANFNTQHKHTSLAKKTQYKAIYNRIIVHNDTRGSFQFKVTLGNSTYNGFPGFMGQICHQSSYWVGRCWAVFFFQWLNDNEFGGQFPNLNKYTMHGFWHWPFSYNGRFERWMGDFGSDSASRIAYCMLWPYAGWDTFGQKAEHQWKAEASTLALAGIEFTFSFSYDLHSDTYYVAPPSYTIYDS